MFPTRNETKMLLCPMWHAAATRAVLHTFISNETHFAVTHDTRHAVESQPSPPTILPDPGQSGFPALLQPSGYTQTEWELCVGQPQAAGAGADPSRNGLKNRTRGPEINFTTDTLTIFSTTAAGRH